MRREWKHDNQKQSGSLKEKENFLHQKQKRSLLLQLLTILHALIFIVYDTSVLVTMKMTNIIIIINTLSVIHQKVLIKHVQKLHWLGHVQNKNNIEMTNNNDMIAKEEGDYWSRMMSSIDEISIQTPPLTTSTWVISMALVVCLLCCCWHHSIIHFFAAGKTKKNKQHKTHLSYYDNNIKNIMIIIIVLFCQWYWWWQW